MKPSRISIIALLALVASTTCSNVGSLVDAGSSADADVDTDADADTDADCTCEAGPCCDGCGYLPASVQCDPTAESTESQCASSECGADAQQRGIFRFCSGDSAECGANNLQPGPWSTADECTADQTCAVLGGIAQCHDCPGGCADGACAPLCDSTPSWTEHVVDTEFNVPHWVHTADLDGDGDADVIASGQGAIVVWVNTAGDGSIWDMHAVTSGYIGNHAGVDAADMDGDGDMDVLGGAYDGSIAWWSNLAGDGSDWGWQEVAGGAVYATSVFAADMDSDGDMDVLGAMNESETSFASWWENTEGDGTVWSEHEVVTGYQSPSSVIAADLDGDGDADVFGALFSGNAISWWENTDGEGDNWTGHSVSDDLGQPAAVFAADLDGDGDLDVISADYGAWSVDWWENTEGDGNAWSRHEVGGFVEAPMSVVAADLDGDTDMDVLVAVYGADFVAWWENAAGDGTAWTEHQVAGPYLNAHSVVAADVDEDGDLDVVGSALADEVPVAWWESDCIP